MIRYLKANKRMIGILLLASILLFAQRIIWVNIGYDTDQYLADPQQTYDTWISSGRYILAFIDYLFGGIWKNLHVANLLTSINTAIYAVLFVGFLNLGNENPDKKRDLITALVLISSPIFLEQYYFTLQAVEMSFSIVLMVSTYIATYYWIVEERKQYSIVIVVLLTLCFGIYQMHVGLYIMGALFVLLKADDKDSKKNVKNIIRCIVVWTLALLVYSVIKRIVGYSLNITDNGYLKSQIGWLNGSFLHAIYVIARSFGYVLLGYGHVLNLSFSICVIFVLWKIIKSGKCIIWKNFYLIALLISPLLINILFAYELTIRSILGLPFVCAFVYWLFYRESKWLRVAALVVILSQVVNGQLLLYSDHIRYENDVAVAEKIYTDCNADADTVIVIKGMQHPEDTVFSFKGQVLGRSFFEWTTDEKNADEYRIRYFMQLHGMDYALPTAEQYQKLEQVEFTGSFPQEGYIIEDDSCYYVNFADKLK